MATGDPTTRELEGLRELIAADLPDYLDDLRRLVDIDCGSYTPEGVDEVGRWVAGFLSGLGADVDIRPDPRGPLRQHGHRHLRRHGRRRRGSCSSATWTRCSTRGPWPSARSASSEGIAHGPGVTDMKSGLLAGLYALKAIINEVGGLPFGRVTFIANPDEEIGSPSSTPHIRALAADADACLVLECARANGDIVSSRKGILDTRLTVHGRAAHAGVEPEKGRSAILEASRLIRDLHALNGRWPGVTVNVGKIVGGHATQRRGRALRPRGRRPVGDERGPRRGRRGGARRRGRDPGAGRDRRRPRPRRLAADGEAGPRGRLVEHAREVAQRLGFEVGDAATGGASDANTTAGMGVPSLDGLGPIGGNDHSPAEYLEVDSVVPRTTLLAGLLLAIARDPDIRAWREDDPRFAAATPVG